MPIRNHRILVVGGLLAALLIASCQSPAATKPEPTASDKVGSLSLNIVAIAPWLADSQKGLSNPRAFLYATSAKVSIKNSGGADVISPVTIATSLNNGSTGTATGTLSTIGNIEAGSNYSVTVQLYNSAVSSSTPVVSGTTTGVTIEANASTTIDTTCVPYGASTLFVNTAQSPSLPAYSEKWYQVSTMGGLTYTVKKPVDPVSLFVFSSTGILVADVTSSDYVLTPGVNTTYYLGVATGATAYSPSILVSTPVTNEGSVASPVALVLDSNRSFKLGTPSHGFSSSYYQFTTSTAGVYYLVIDSAAGPVLYQPALYSDSTYSTMILSFGSYISDDCSLGTLAADTTYYLKLTNGSSAANTLTARVVSPETTSVDSYSEGTVEAPVSVLAGTPKAFTLGSMPWDKTSFYSFTTGNTPTTSFAVSGLSSGLSGVSIVIYSNSTFGSFVTSQSLSSSSWAASLSPNTTYYFTLSGLTGFTGVQGTGSLSIESSDIAFLPLTLDAAYMTHTVSGTPAALWFEVTVPSAGIYRVAWDDSFSGSGTKTQDVRVSAYDESWGVYFSGIDSGYLSPSSVTVASGQTKIRIKVTAFSAANLSTGATFGLRVYTPSFGSLIVNVH